MINLYTGGQSICAQFRVASQTRCISSGGRDFVKLILEDYSGHITCIVWEPEFFAEILVGLHENDPLIASGQTKQLGSGIILEINTLLELDESSLIHAAELIPRSLTSFPELLDDLILSINSIQNKPLRDFCHSVFSDLSIAKPFLEVQASIDHHHSYAGGLAEHSIEVVKIIEETSGLNPIDRDLAKVGGLLHDLGKIRTLSNPRRQSLYLDHDLLILDILSKQLSFLDEIEPLLADQLRYVWTFRRSQPKRDPATPAAKAVLDSDRISVVENQKIKAA